MSPAEKAQLTRWTRLKSIQSRMAHPAMNVNSQFFKIINQPEYTDLRAELRKINSVR